MSGGFRRWGWVLVIVGAVLAGRGILVRQQSEAELARDSGMATRWQVEVTHGHQEKVMPDLVIPGQLQAWVDTPLYAHASGYLKRWNADIGERVKAGQVIAEIRTPDLDAEEAQAQAQLHSAEANAELARVTAERYKVLLPSHTVSFQDVDNKRLDAVAQQHTLEAARANWERLQALDQYRFITAPFNGIVTVRHVDIGSMVDSGSANGQATELFHMADIHRMRAYVPVSESDVAGLPQTGNVNLTFRSFPGKSWKAQLVRRAHAVDRRAQRDVLRDRPRRPPAGCRHLEPPAALPCSRRARGFRYCSWPTRASRARPASTASAILIQLQGRRPETLPVTPFTTTW